MRYTEQAVQPPKGEKEKPEKEREMTKPGQYSSEQLRATKDRPFLGGNSFGRR